MRLFLSVLVSLLVLGETVMVLLGQSVLCFFSLRLYFPFFLSSLLVLLETWYCYVSAKSCDVCFRRREAVVSGEVLAFCPVFLGKIENSDVLPSNIGSVVIHKRTTAQLDLHSSLLPLRLAPTFSPSHFSPPPTPAARMPTRPPTPSCAVSVLGCLSVLDQRTNLAGP